MRATVAALCLQASAGSLLLSCGGRRSEQSSRPTTWRATVPRASSSEDLELEPSAEPSLVPQTLREMEADAELQASLSRLEELGQVALTAEERKQRRRALDSLGIESFESFLASRVGEAAGGSDGSGGTLSKRPITLLQLNVGLTCNQACTHCHVESSPSRDESMSPEMVEKVIRLLRASPSVETVDITGGAPEMHAAFRPLVCAAAALGKEVIDRCNLTVLREPGMEWLPPFLKEHKVRIVASLPCYSAENVDKQRGDAVFERSISALQELNALGYGQPGSGLVLDLVYNPGGAFLPPAQAELKAAYAKQLDDHFGIQFNDLFTITNMPIKRFADQLAREGKLAEYMQLLVDNFNPQTLEALMCRSLLSVSHDGKLYDCDFNLALASPIGGSPAGADARYGDITQLDSLSQLEGGAIQTGNHCFGCTAGMGSS